jgi:uncharacterized protein with PhoU and TrkA domain
MANDSPDDRSLMDRLAQMRDEVRLKLHLGKEELKEEVEQLETRWRELQTKVQPAAEETAREVGAAAKDLMAELQKGYQRVKDAL